jgi:two-component sensor histidine kinase
MNSLHIRYETEKKEQQIELLQKQGHLKNVEIKAKQTMIYGLSAGVLLLTAIVALIFNNFRIARKGKMMQELFNKELNHRVKNNLQLLASVLSLQSQELTDETAVTAVKRNESRVNAMALIHRKLYLGDNTRTVNMRDYIRELVDFLLYSSSYANDEIAINLDIEEMDLDVDKAIPLGLIINELISNSLKYAFHSEKEPAITVKLKTIKGKDLLLSVHDNGSGFVPSAVLPEQQSFGLKMIHLLTRELRGNIRIESEAGTCANIKIPLK